MKHVTHIRLVWVSAVALMLALPAAGADYLDDFSSDKAQSDAYLHSTFWTLDANPLPEPYLQYLETESRGLLFMDYADQPARLGYCLPITATYTHRIITGTLTVDVDFPCNETVSQYPTAGELSCSTSPDGMTWSWPQYLHAGRNTIPVASDMGKCYVVFSGARVMIDNIQVSLSPPSATLYVPRDYSTIQQAIDAARTGDVIEVAAGTYRGSGNWDIDFQGKRITVRSADGAARTIIDCESPAASSRRGFYFHRGETTDSVLSGFTIRRGRVYGKEIPADPLRWTQSASHPIGGGIYCEFSSPTIAGCVIEDCHAELGGGIGCVGAGPTILDCTIQECLAGGLGSAGAGGHGAGIAVVGESDATIMHCVVQSNRTYYEGRGAGLYVLHSWADVAGCTFSFSDNFGSGTLQGGGAYCGGEDTDVTFRNCVFSNNQADAGAGILVERITPALPSVTVSNSRCAVAVINCTIAQNALTYALGSSTAGGVNSNGAIITISNSIIWDNDGAAVTISNPADSYPVTYSNIQGSYSGTGNISADPLFASPASLDYHLKSTGGRYNPQTGAWVNDNVCSPCIDAGDWVDSAEYEPPLNGDRINMGAYGGTAQASKSAARAIFHVSKTGRDSNTGRSESKAFATIEKAIDAAAQGDIILVWPGEYVEEISFMGKAITVQSAADAAVLTAPNYACTFTMGESEDSVLANFVITGCGLAGIYCDYGASPTLKNLTIVDNQFGIVSYHGSAPTISNCILWDNADGDLFQCNASYSCIGHANESKGTGNISSDPLFANAAGGDYHLRSPYGRYVPGSGAWTTDTAMSPCIDKGDPSEYPRCERVPNGNRINMGAYGGTLCASKSSGPRCP
ncbi:MAG: right-handed parallel beta-helix repeat-containing protein [Phycisphaerales bacterium]